MRRKSQVRKILQNREKRDAGFDLDQEHNGEIKQEFDELDYNLKSKNNDQTRQYNWYCIEVEGFKTSRIISFNEVELNGTELEIGSVVTTNLNGKNINGMLVCSSGMGLTTLDLFNDIFVDENDIKFFIEQHNIHPVTTFSGMIIQAYLVFCCMIGENANVPILDFMKADKNTEDADYQTMDYPTAKFYDELEDHSLHDIESESVNNTCTEILEVVSCPIKKSRKTCVKKRSTGDVKNAVHLEDLIKIRIGCEICHPTSYKAIVEWESAKYDRYLSQHMLEDHQIQDSVHLSNENVKRISKHNVPPFVIIDGVERLQCDECKTTFGKSCPQDYRQHKDYHDKVRTRMDSSDNDFPCLDCSMRFEEYHKYKLHASETHPKYNFKCRYCKQGFRNKERRRNHVNLVHEANNKLFCEICSKQYTNIEYFKNHMESHDSDNQQTCDICGKTFGNKANLRHHRLKHFREPRHCNECGMSFDTDKQLESHHVTKHGAERRFTCEFCGAKFIHQKHLARHRKNIHKDPNKHYNPRAPRSANKAPYPHVTPNVNNILRISQNDTPQSQVLSINLSVANADPKAINQVTFTNTIQADKTRKRIVMPRIQQNPQSSGIINAFSVTPDQLDSQYRLAHL